MAKEKEKMEPTLESLEPIRQTIRRLCIQDQSTWEHSWDSVLSDVHQTRRGLLLPDVFQHTLALNAIHLTPTAFHALVQQFQHHTGAVQAHQFLRWIDLSKPTDHIDPELVFARLPQPYRRIVKVLEWDILDVAWATIQQTSATYKAKTAGVKTARPSGWLPLEEDAVGLCDDYASATKRCCRVSKEVVRPLGAGETVGMLSVHCRRPFAVLGWQGEESELVLQLIHTERCTTIATMTVALPSTPVENAVSRKLQLIQAGELRSGPASETSEEEFLALAIHVREEVSTGDTMIRVEYVLLYEFPTVSTPPRLLTSLVFSDPHEIIQCLTLSSDASLLAIATSKAETMVYSVLPSHPADAASLPPVPLITKILSDAPADAVFFLYPPIVHSPTQPSPSSGFANIRPYAMAVVFSKALIKYLLRPLEADNSSSATVSATWPHLSAITSSSLDATSQFLTVGVADGMVVVWDLLMDRDHVILTPPPSLSSTNTAVDAVFYSGDQFVVSLSLASQRLVFYNVANRATPAVIRIVTPPPSPSSFFSSSGSTESIRFVSLSHVHSPLLDIPIAMVTYSTGYVLLYDIRTGEAITSVRVATTLSLEETTGVVPATSAVVVLTPLPVVVAWNDLLKTAFPDQRVPSTTDNVKRSFLANVDNATFSLNPTASLQSLLQSSAGLSLSHSLHHTPAIKYTGSESLLSASKSSSGLSQAPFTNDSRTSIPTEHESLPPLMEPAPFPYKPNQEALFQRLIRDETGSSSLDAKLHRRRTELLKLLTAAW